MVRQTAGIVILELLAGFALIVMLVILAIAWQLSSGPVDISFLKPRIETAIESARNGRPVEIDTLKLEWVAGQRQVGINADGVRIYSESEELIAEAGAARIDLSMVALLGGKIELDTLVLVGGEVGVHHHNDGSLVVAGEHFEFPPPPDGSWLDVTNNALSNFFGILQDAVSETNFNYFVFEDITINVISDPLGIEWTLNDADLSLTKEEDLIELSATGLAEGEGAPENVLTRFATRDAFKTAELHIEADSFDIGGLLNRFGAPFELTTNSDPDIRMTALGTAEEGLSMLSTTFVSDAMELAFNDHIYAFAELDFSSAFSVEEDYLEVRADAFEFDRFNGAFTLETNNAIALLTSPLSETYGIQVRSDRFIADVTPTFERTWVLENFQLDATVKGEERLIDIQRIALKERNLDTVGQGRITIPEHVENQSSVLPVGIALTARTLGKVGSSDVLRYWPVNLGEGARNWAKDNILGGEIYGVEFQLDIEPDDLADGYLSNEDLVLEFRYRDAEVKFLSDFPSGTNGAGRGTLFGNSFSLDLLGANLGAWDLRNGKVSLDGFVPKGRPIEIVVDGSGDATSVVKMVSDSRLQLENQYGLDPTAITGDGSLRFKLSRPALSDVSYEDTRFSLDGSFTEAGFRSVVRETDLTDSSVRVMIDNELLTVDGYGSFGEAPVQFRYSEAFFSGDEPSTTLNASGIVTPDVLNRFGIAARAYLTGETSVELISRGNGQDVENLQVAFDLSNNRIDASEFGWVKPRGEPATADLAYIKSDDEQLMDLKIRGEGAEVDGKITLNPAGQFQSLQLNRAYVAEQLDVAGTVERSEGAKIFLNLNGAFLNAEPFVGDIMSIGGGTPVFGEVEIASAIQELRLKQGLVLREARMDANIKGPVIEGLEISGASQSGARIDLGIASVDEDRQIKLVAEDAGFLISAFLGGNFIQGGKLDLGGTIRPGGQSSTFDIEIEDARLRNAPLLTQLLSLASLQGLADVLGGDGILLSEVQIPLTVTRDRMVFDGVRASGPALGLTANGWLSTSKRELDVRGVLVPSFGLNSALGGVPIIGDLFVSRKGEGLFAINYYARGPMEDATVGINPLSAITPGVLRRIFENPADTSIGEEVETVDE